MTSIRTYTHADYDMLSSWYKDSSEPCVPKDLLPEDTTFVLELEGVPALCVSVYLTNCKGVAYLEHFIGNPSLKGKERQKATSLFFEAMSVFVKGCGYKRIACSTVYPKLKQYYKKLGLVPTNDNVQCFIKEVV